MDKTKYKYQLVILGELDSRVEDITSLLYQSIEELKLNSEFYKIIKKENFDAQYLGNQPTFVLFWGSTAAKDQDNETLQRLIIDGNPILPIFLNQFDEEIPIILENQNGLKYDATKNIKIVNLILEFFGKLRETRKVFISYRRDQSTSVAIQLYEALERNNFDVFLDTHSIKQGEPFQDELWHRMTDCDVIVLLNTSKFLESKWCKEEIAQASTKKIGVIQLVWPDHELENMAELSFPRKLDNADFIGGISNNSVSSRLNETVINQVVEDVESVRARTLASRQDDITANFMNVAKRYGKKVNIQPERFITEEIGEGKRRIFIPTVGIPQSINCEQSSELRKEIIEFSVDEIYLIYDNLSIRERWIKHLAYLNQYLDVKTLKKSEIETVWNPELVKNIFLSASIPLATRKPKYFETADIVAIRDAVIALTTAVLPKHRLIWGGHPSITPLIYDVMNRLGLNIQEHVTIYQSKYYQDKFPEDNFKFENIILTESTGEKASSEDIMRSKMLGENEFAAAVFIGGMEGVEREYEMFADKYPNAILLPVASTGAASKIVYENLTENIRTERLLNDYGYISLFQELLINKI